jgi:hypothetical protein
MACLIINETMLVRSADMVMSRTFRMHEKYCYESIVKQNVKCGCSPPVWKEHTFFQVVCNDRAYLLDAEFVRVADCEAVVEDIPVESVSERIAQMSDPMPGQPEWNEVRRDEANMRKFKEMATFDLRRNG